MDIHLLPSFTFLCLLFNKNVKLIVPEIFREQLYVSSNSKWPQQAIMPQYDELESNMCFGLFVLTLLAPCISESCIKTKTGLNFYFHTSLWCLKRFYEGLKGHKEVRK